MASTNANAALVAGLKDVTAHANEAIKGKDARHPVETIQRESFAREVRTKQAMLGKVYGMAFPARLHMEKMIVSGFRRPAPLAGLSSSHTALETLLGKDDTIEIEDYLDVPEFSEELVDVHAAMEKQFDETHE